MTADTQFKPWGGKECTERYMQLIRLPKVTLVAKHLREVTDVIYSRHPIAKWDKDTIVQDLLRAEGFRR